MGRPFKLMYREPTSVFQFKIPTYAFYAYRSHFLTPGHSVKLGGTNLHQRKLIFPALHLTTFAAQNPQPIAHRPLFAHAVAPHMLACQQTAASLLIVKPSVMARATTLIYRYAILIDSDLQFLLNHKFIFFRNLPYSHEPDRE